MRKTAIKGVLFSMIGLSVMPAVAQTANEKNDLVLIEELPLEVRASVHAKVVEFLNQNPELMNDASTAAIDSKGTIYVLDKNMSAIASVGQPSCV